jgi:roadblock/LC7 domain-containing protein
MMRTHKASTQKKSKQKDEQLVVFKQFNMSQRQTRIVRRVCSDVITLATNASGFVALTTLASSGLVTSSLNWASYAGAAIEYRVAGLEVLIFPVVNSQTNLTTPVPSFLAVCGFSSGTVPATIGQIIEGPGGKILTGHRPTRFAVGMKGYQDAHLWTPTTGAIVTTEQYGIACMGTTATPAAVASSTYFKIVIKYLVDFRSLD